VSWLVCFSYLQWTFLIIQIADNEQVKRWHSKFFAGIQIQLDVFLQTQRKTQKRNEKKEVFFFYSFEKRQRTLIEFRDNVGRDFVDEPGLESEFFFENEMSVNSFFFLKRITCKGQFQTATNPSDFLSTFRP
jgi:hypothetical protein